MPQAPGASFTGMQTIEIPLDAETVHLGVAVPREQALQVGALLQIYPARPQTSYYQ